MRSQLKQSGFNPASAQASRAHERRNAISARGFYDMAGEALVQLAPVVAEEVVPHLPDLPGRWHPSGFMVYPLGQNAILGALRLHIWPKGFRERHIKGYGQLQSPKLGSLYDGDIHNHAWRVISYNYANYIDHIINLQPINDCSDYFEDNRDSPLDIYRLHRVSYASDGSVRFRRQLLDEHNYGYRRDYGNGWVHAFKSPMDRSMYETDLHIIDAGEFHVPTIDLDTFAATLVINSNRVCEGPDVLLRGQPDLQRYSRLQITGEQAEAAREQLLGVTGRLALTGF